MPPVRTILCPVDFSDASRDALHWAVALAARYQSHLIVLTAVEPLLANAAQVRFKQDLRTDTEPVLKDFVISVLPSLHLRYVLDVQVGHASDVILDAATRHPADLIVMGTHGIGGFQKLLLGSTTERVLRRTPVPILAVPQAEDQSGGAPGVSRAASRITTVLAATDFSEPSDNAVRWAADVAREHDALLLVVHVVAPTRVPVEWAGYVDGVDEERQAAARRQLQERSASNETALRVEHVVLLGPPIESIATTAKARNASLLVMGLTGTERILAPRPGSTAYGVLSSANIPVLVVPAALKS
jgi:nucleotide-binding universal stress UspA family protein